MRYWLMKSEPSCYGVEHLAAEPDQRAPWWGVRNYQARNFMRDQMNPGDRAFFYHSSCPEPGIAGLMEIAARAIPDETQFDPASPFFDPKATSESPRWFSVDVKLLSKTPLVSLKTLRAQPELAQLRILAPGSRLSITPVDPADWRFITERLMGLPGAKP